MYYFQITLAVTETVFVVCVYINERFRKIALNTWMFGRVVLFIMSIYRFIQLSYKTNEELSTDEHRVASCLMLYTFIYELINFFCTAKYIDFNDLETTVENISLIRRTTSHH